MPADGHRVVVQGSGGIPPEPCAGLARCCELLAKQLAKMTEKKPAGVGDFAKDLTTLAGAATGISFIFYLFGFIIVNLRLLSLGIRSFNLADPTFLPAGIAFVAFALGPVALPLSLLLRVQMHPAGKFVWLVVLEAVGVGVGVAVFVAGGVGGLAEIERNGGFFRSAWLAFGWGPILLALAGAVVLGVAAIKKTADRANVIPSAAFLVVCFICVASSQWATRTYERGNSAFGGGRPANVVLVLKLAKDGGMSIPADLGLAGTGNVTTPVRLISENDKAVVVLNDSGQALSLDRALVAEIRYSPQ
jgi:hypothetical protein